MWYNKSIEDIEKELHTSIKGGLNDELVLQNREKYGVNELKEKKKKSFLSKVLDQFKDPLIVILLLAAITSIFIGEKDDSVVIIAIVILNSCLSLYQEGKSEKAIENLQKMSTPNAKVIRNGIVIEIPSKDIVVGDLIQLETGDVVPCDVRLYDIKNLKIDESALTGESVPVEKNIEVLTGKVGIGDRENMAFSSSIVSYGRGFGICVETGQNTEIGKIASIINETSDELTPLQKRLAELSKFLGFSVLFVCAIVFIVGYVRGFKALDIFMISISLAVAAIPEGLPAIVTIVLSIGMTNMAKKNAIVKKLLAVETLGATTFICSDKTGTLTQNQMSVTDLFTNLTSFQVTGRGYFPNGDILKYPKNKENVDKNSPNVYEFKNIDISTLIEVNEIQYSQSYSQVIRNIDVENTKKIDKNQVDDHYENLKDYNINFITSLISAAVLNNDASLDEDYNMIGDPTEGSLLTLGEKIGLKKQNLNDSFKRIAEIPFDSERKMMTTFHNNFVENKVISFTKGALDSILARCDKILINNKIYQMNDVIKKRIINQNIAYTDKALRVLTFAYREYLDLPSDISSANIEKNLTFIGLIAMIDPPREEAKVAIKECKSAGITAMMITGDHKDTAFAIANQLGIAKDKSEAITGAELDKLSLDELKEIVKVKRVYARVSPQNKVSIVDALKSNNQIVAMTGDGVNDAPAIKKADIGVAMGITGTDVTKSTAEVILTDDNFATIVNAVEEGRIIYSNIKKFIGFVLPCNISEIVIMFTTIVANLDIAFLPIQLLWINLVTDSFPALAIGVETSEKNIMNRKPRDINEPILDKKMMINIVIQTIFLSGSVLFAYIFSKNLDLPRAISMYGSITIAEKYQIFSRTVAVATLVLSEMLRSYSSRSSESIFKIGIFSNKALIIATLTSLLTTGVVIYVPVFAKLFRFVALDLKTIGFIIPIAFIPFIVGEITKLFNKK